MTADILVRAFPGFELQPGLFYAPDYLDRAAQEKLLAEVRACLEVAPLYTAHMPKSGLPLSVRMSNCGPLGWLTDREKGYRYEQLHPETDRAWPAIPQLAGKAWRDLGFYFEPPQACLINYYGPAAKMGLHQDRDETALDAPVVSLSLGDTCLFRYGGLKRRDPTRTIKLNSGDAIVLGGEARLLFHGVDRILSGSSTLLAEGGRFNLTLRRVSDAKRH
jgi:alkylated DNA repair protein (DNA oxidative demethylase)